MIDNRLYETIRELIASPSFAKLNEAVRSAIFESIADSPPEDREGRELLYTMLRLQDLYAAQMVSIVNEGELLKGKELREAALKRSRAH